MWLHISCVRYPLCLSVSHSATLFCPGGTFLCRRLGHKRRRPWSNGPSSLFNALLPLRPSLITAGYYYCLRYIYIYIYLYEWPLNLGSFYRHSPHSFLVFLMFPSQPFFWWFWLFFCCVLFDFSSYQTILKWYVDDELGMNTIPFVSSSF